MALSFVMLIVAFGAVFFRIWNAEKDASAREVTSVARAFDNYQQAITSEMKRYAASNAAYLNVETSFSGPWIKSRFADDMAKEFQHSALFLLTPDRSISFENNFFPETISPDALVQHPLIASSVAHVQSNFLRLLEEARTFPDIFSRNLDQFYDIQPIKIEDEAALVAVFAIVPDPGGIELMPSEPHVLLTVHMLDRAHLDTVLHSLSLSDLNFGVNVPKGMNSLEIVDRSGRQIGNLFWLPMSQATAILVSSAPLLLLFICVIAGLATISIIRNAKSQKQLFAAAKKLEKDAHSDNLTGLFLRRQFVDQADRALSNNTSGRASLVLFDINHLKHINDTWGSAAGDEVLKATANRIKNMIGQDDLAGRTGGDEFFVLLNEQVDAVDGESVTHDVLASLNQPIIFEGNTIEFSCRASIARFPEHGESMQDLIRAASVAMLHSRLNAHSALCSFETTMDSGLRENRELRKDLLTALQNGEIELCYQRIMDTVHDRTSSAEALVRWNHPTKGQIPPARFLPLAEDAGVMHEIGRWVLQQAIKDAATWPMGFGVSVNVNTAQFLQRDFAAEVRALLTQHGLPAQMLTIEITETEILDRVAATHQVQSELKELGVNFALDDFGTGYSSLSYLHLYEFDILKVDKSFLLHQNFTDNTKGLLSTMINIGKVLGMSTVVEGVETEEQLVFLRQSGCDFVQGFLFAHPVPYSKLVDECQSDLSNPRNVSGGAF